MKMKILTFLLLAIIILSLGCGKQDIGIEKAKEIALQDAGVEADDVTFVATIKTDLSISSKSVYIVAFFNGETEYDYEIDIGSGAILTSDNDIEDFEASEYPDLPLDIRIGS